MFVSTPCTLHRWLLCVARLESVFSKPVIVIKTSHIHPLSHEWTKFWKSAFPLTCTAYHLTEMLSSHIHMSSGYFLSRFPIPPLGIDSMVCCCTPTIVSHWSHLGPDASPFLDVCDLHLGIHNSLTPLWVIGKFYDRFRRSARCCSLIVRSTVNRGHRVALFSAARSCSSDEECARLPLQECTHQSRQGMCKLEVFDFLSRRFVETTTNRFLVFRHQAQLDLEPTQSRWNESSDNTLCPRCHVNV